MTTYNLMEILENNLRPKKTKESVFFFLSKENPFLLVNSNTIVITRQVYHVAWNTWGAITLYRKLISAVQI